MSEKSTGGLLVLKLVMAGFVAMVCWITAAHASPKATGVVSVTVDCASVDGSYVECDAGTAFTDVQMTAETSRAGLCQYGSTWGSYGNSVWVNHGCSGRFEVTVDTARQPAPPPQRPLPITQTSCRYNGTNWQPFYSAGNHWIGLVNFGFNNLTDCQLTLQLSRRNAVCNWVGNGFTPYDIESNRAIYFAAYPDLQSCYDVVP